MKIGIIGPTDSSSKIKNCLESLNENIEINLYIKEQISETHEVIKECEENSDGIIFTGCGVEASVKSKYKVRKPNSYVSRSSTSLLKAFFELKEKNLPLDNFSIDVLGKNLIDDILLDLELTPSNMFHMPFSESLCESDYIKWHIELFNKNKTQAMLTCFAGVYNELKLLGYPVYRLEATRPLIKAAYEKIRSTIALNKAQSSQLAVVILTLLDYKGDDEKYYSNMIKKTNADKLIIDYVRSIQGSVFNFGRAEYIIFSNKGLIDCRENYNALLNLQKEINSIGFNTAMGIGSGLTAYQAESNAYKASKRSLSSKDSSLYSINEKEILKGPLESSREINYTLKASDEHIMEISKKTSLSCESLNKILSISIKRKNNVFDSKELANYLDISERSARRILNKLLKNGFAKIFAKESSKNGGRPKNLIEINLTKNN